jgi:hypothetical protein
VNSKHNIAIEYQGEQHFKNVDYFEILEKNIENDFIKKQKCKKIYNRHNSFVSKGKLFKHIL